MESDDAVLNHEVGVGGTHVDSAGAGLCAVLGNVNVERSLAPEKLSQKTLVLGGQVLRDQDGQRKTHRDIADEFLERLQPTRTRSDTDDVEGARVSRFGPGAESDVALRFAAHSPSLSVCCPSGESENQGHLESIGRPPVRDLEQRISRPESQEGDLGPVEDTGGVG